MKKTFVVAFLIVAFIGLFLSPIAAADNIPSASIAGEWVGTSKMMSSILLVGPIDDNGEFFGSFATSTKGSVSLSSFGHGKISEGKIHFILYSLHPDGCGEAVVSGEMMKSGEMMLIFSPPPSTIACTSSGKPFTAVFKRAVKDSSKGPVGGGPTGETADRGGHPVGGGRIN